MSVVGSKTRAEGIVDRTRGRSRRFWRLRSVRSKLFALVFLSATVALAALAVVGVLVHGQLDSEVDDHIPETLRALDLVLDDDVGDVEFVATQLATNPSVERGLSASDPAPLRVSADAVRSAYPDVELAFFDPAGKLVVFIGADEPPADVAALSGPTVGADSTMSRGLGTGCGRGDSGSRSYTTKRRTRAGSIVAVCLHFDRDYLDRTSARIGAEVGAGAPPTFQASRAFPLSVLPESESARPSLLRVDDRAWGYGRHASPIRGTGESLPTIVAVDLSATAGALIRNLLVATGVLLFGTFVVMLIGWQLASVMSSSLGRVSRALRKLERQEYVHVDAVRSGDEIEDLAVGFNAMVDGLQERDRIRATFGKYVTPHVVDFLLEGRVELGGQTLPVTILFTDIRGFTGISERMDAHALVALLNEYFTAMVTIIIDEGGVVDKYIGDAIMAVFGAPIGKPDDPVRAVRAAIRMRAALRELNTKLVAEGRAPLSTGIGLHTGEVVAGNIGSDARMEYTVIGDAVNLAARIESSTKELDVDILISDATFALVEGSVSAARVGEIRVKGREREVVVYAVTGPV